jgi:hypothetical protein
MGKNNSREKRDLNELQDEDRKYRDNKSQPKRREPYKRDRKRIVYEDQSDDSYEEADGQDEGHQN